MKTENKYYTPTLEELIQHVISGEDVYGLIHESEEVIQFINKPTLTNLMEFIQSSSNIEDDKIISLTVENFRIKHLDIEDIESLGFKVNPADTVNSGLFVINDPHSEEQYGDFKGFYYSDRYYENYFVKSDLKKLNKQELKEFKSKNIELVGARFFIKNKSELKKVMQMLNINTREDGE